MSPFRVVALFVLLLAAACSAPQPPSAEPGPRRQMDRLTTEEIVDANVADALTLISQHRPRWLSRRGADTITLPGGGVVVYVNGTRFGGAGSLSAISTSTIASIQFLGGMAASSRFGLDHDDGAILISTIR